jgi:hypothetical protein
MAVPWQQDESGDVIRLVHPAGVSEPPVSNLDEAERMLPEARGEL